MKRYIVHLTKTQLGALNEAVETRISDLEGNLGGYVTKTDINNLLNAQSGLFKGQNNGLKTVKK